MHCDSRYKAETSPFQYNSQDSNHVHTYTRNILLQARSRAEGSEPPPVKSGRSATHKLRQVGKAG
jgi:hypothetical protein